jgi:hypothetical protein
MEAGNGSDEAETESVAEGAATLFQPVKALQYVVWGIDNNLTRKLSSADPVLIAVTKGLVAGTVNVALAFLRDAAFPSFEVSGGAAVVGFLGVGVNLVLFVLALRHLGAARTGAYFSLAPFVGELDAIVLLHDPLSVHEHEHDALEHEHSHTHDEHHQHKHDGLVTEPHSHRHRRADDPHPSALS